MKIYIVETYETLNMSDVVLTDYDIFTDFQKVINKFPDTILASTLNVSELEQAIEKELNRFMGIAYVIVEKNI